MPGDRLPAYYDETCYQGDQWSTQYRFLDDDDELLNTDGWTGAMTIKATLDASTALLSSAAGTITLVVGVDGDEQASTTLAAGVTEGYITVTVADATGIVTGDTLKVTLDDASTHVATITEVAGTDITIATEVPGAATTGNAVVSYADAYCLDVLIPAGTPEGSGGVPDGTASLPDGLVGVYDLSLTSASGQTTTFLKGDFAVDTEVG